MTDTTPTDPKTEPTKPAEESAAPTESPTETPAETPVETPVAAAPPPAPAPVAAPRASMGAGQYSWGTGRRKSAVARVRIRPGDGKFVVNLKSFEHYFTEERDRKDLLNVLEKTNAVGSVDVHVNVKGGGYTGQAGAIVLGLGRALLRYDGSLEPVLRDNNFLTRDPRKVERKKYGQRGARRKFQFSKR